MQQQVTISLPIHLSGTPIEIKEAIGKHLSLKTSSITGFKLIKRSIDARSKNIKINYTLLAFIDEPFKPPTPFSLYPQSLTNTSKKVIIVGAGPAGLFAAIKLIEQGIKPIIIERGKDVRNRRHDLAAMNKKGIVNPESNYCFGEGGAGTYSDGKLYTRSNKRGDINRILNILHHFGAGEHILYEAHPHIGTNKLPQIITAMRHKILEWGGEIFFDKKLIDFVLKKGQIDYIKTQDGACLYADAYIIATGHSAQDIYELLHRNKIVIEAKPFALGVRVEHPQHIIDRLQYKCLTSIKPTRPQLLPPASYSLVEQVEGRGVFSFCMCPGGIIAPAATNTGEIVVNGWSPSKRNNPYANSGMVVSISPQDWDAFEKYGPLAALYFQRDVEQRAFTYGGGSLKAPAQRLSDYISNKESSSLPACSYLPGITSAALSQVLPPAVNSRLKQGLIAFGKKMRNNNYSFITHEAVLVATESRTSSPVRIPRNIITLEHVQIKNVYPCGEGAGYAGGIVSAAIDGENVATAIALKYR